jgi:hypothetical protein
MVCIKKLLILIPGTTYHTGEDTGETSSEADGLQ